MKTATLLLLLVFPAGAAAQGLGPGIDPYRPEITRSYAAFGLGYSDAEGLDHRSASLGGNAVLGKRLSLESGFAAHRITRDGWLPGNLYNAGAALNYRSGRYSFSGGLRSASDRPFYSAHETDLGLNASRVISSKGPHRLSFGLAYSSRRSFARGIPFPYLLYSYRTEKFTFLAPFSASWRPSPEYELSASYMPPKSFRAGVSRKLSDKLRLGTYYYYGTLQFDLARRPDKDYTTFIEQHNAGLSVNYARSKEHFIQAYAGWAIKGRYYNGRTYDDHHDSAAIRSGFGAGLSFYRHF